MSNVIPTDFGILTIYRGTKRILEFLINDEDGNPKDLTGWVLQFRTRVSEFATDPVLDETAVVADQSGDERGICRVTLSRATTLSWAARTYNASLFRPLDGDEDLIAIGLVDVKNTIYDKGRAAGQTS